MSVFPGSTIAVLCYARETEFDFRTLVTDMWKAVWDTTGGMRLDMPSADLVFCDMPDMRITLSRVEMRREFPGSLTAGHYPVCILLSVGPGMTGSDTPMTARFARTRAELVAGIQEIEAADRVLMFERAGAYDTEAHDEVVVDIRFHLDRVLAPSCTPSRAPVSDELRARPAPTAPAAVSREPAPAVQQTALSAPATDPDGAHGGSELDTAGAPEPEDIIQGLASRVDAEIARLERARHAFEKAEAATDRRAQKTHGMRVVVPRIFPGLPPSTLGLFRFPGKARAGGADYPDFEHMPANVDDRPLLHRAAVNALNVTVMTIALPVGAALLTMSVLGREDMLFSSRVTAVTGVGVGLYNTGVAQSLFSLFS